MLSTTCRVKSMLLPKPGIHRLLTRASRGYETPTMVQMTPWGYYLHLKESTEMVDSVGLVCLKTGKLHLNGGDEPPETAGNGVTHMWVPVVKGEPYFIQNVGSTAAAHGRTDDGRFDKTHLSPEKAWRIGRDYLAHCIRYGFPMKVIKEHFGPGARIMEMGCGKEIPLFRTLTCDHSAVKYYKPSVYVAADLNSIMYRPRITGCQTHILANTNIVDEKEKVPDEVFDIVVSFEVLEHMGKADGNRFLDAMFDFARRKVERENKPGMILLSTPVNGGKIAKNHIYEYGRSELRRMFEKRGGVILEEYGTFSNLRDLMSAMDDTELEVWNRMAAYHSPHTLSCVFSAMHPEAARNIVWKVEVPV